MTVDLAPVPTASWDTIQHVFYRKEELYALPWAVGDLADYLVAAAKNGGPIALMRDERKIVQLGSHTSGKPKINVYTSSGLPLATFNWELPPPILLHFTTTHLVVLSDEGVYRMYDLSDPSVYTQHTLGSDVERLGLVGAKAWDDGLVVLTGELQFVQLRGWKGGRIAPMAPSGLTSPPHAWTIVTPDVSTSGHVEVMFSTDSTVVTVDTLDRIDQRVSRGPFTSVLLSPNGRFLALLTATNTLWVVSADFSRNLSEVHVGAFGDGAPDQAAWCGDNAVVLSWGGKAIVVGPSGDYLEFDHPPTVQLVPEVDSLRILGTSAHWLIQKVPDALLAVFGPGSTHPAAVLYDALEHFERRSSRADEAVRAIRPELARAVDGCVEAAAVEWNVELQRRLLKAAQFGRAFMDLYNPIDFVTTGQTLKVLNAVRYYEIGIPITYEQYQSAGPSALLAALTARNAHLVALRIAQHLSLAPAPVLAHWAAAKIARAPAGAAEDERLCALIVRKFEHEGGGGRVGVAGVARGAWEMGRKALATLLLDHEPRAAEQVPLLLQMKQDKIALEKAIDSGDTDLVYQVLLHLRAALSPGDFFHLLDDSISPHLAPAVRLLQVYARDGDRQLLRDFYYQDDRRTESAVLEMDEAGESSDSAERLQHLSAAAKSFSENKDRAFEARMTEDAHRLLVLQQTYERELEFKFVFAGLTVTDFIGALLREGLGKRAERVRADWKVPDKRWWWVKLKALAANHDWEGLEAFAKSRKSAIGYEPFVTHLLALTPPQPQRAAAFVARCDARARPDLYARCGEWGRAAEAARERGDRAKLDELRRAAPAGLAQREVDDVVRRAK
ncbi:Vacuolar protein sorting-associated protein 16 [Cryptotrichosporon argae]